MQLIVLITKVTRHALIAAAMMPMRSLLCFVHKTNKSQDCSREIAIIWLIENQQDRWTSLHKRQNQ